MKRKADPFPENRITVLRREKKIKQIDLAKALDVSPSYLCKIEKSSQEPTAKFMKACSEFLEVPETEIFPGKRDRKEKLNTENAVSNNLWTVRRARGIKQYELARMLDCSPSYLSKVEKGMQRPNDKFKKACAKILKVKGSELFPVTD